MRADLDDRVAASLFALSAEIRYVALYRHGELRLHARPDLRNASAAESDRYEELIVNPTLITLARQRGAIDCGGLEFLLIRYGYFFQLIQPIAGGHLSVAIEPSAAPLALVPAIRGTAVEHGLLADEGTLRQSTTFRTPKQSP
jgi:hypothetical protein